VPDVVFEGLAGRAGDGLGEDEVAEVGVEGLAAAGPPGLRVPGEDPSGERRDVGLVCVGREHPAQRKRVGRTRGVVEQLADHRLVAGSGPIARHQGMDRSVEVE
jgi:hypothetical protein